MTSRHSKPKATYVPPALTSTKVFLPMLAATTTGLPGVRKRPGPFR